MNDNFIKVILKYTDSIKIEPAARKRDWMEETSNKFAYRCLPLTIANQYGWDILMPYTIEAVWNGGPGIDAVTITSDEHNYCTASRFGSGILTIMVEANIRTDKSTNLMVTGPFNQGKSYIYPLTGIIETDWIPYTFTMNYKFTEPNKIVRFEKGEPFCRILPVPKHIENYEFTIDNISNYKEIAEEEQKWVASRNEFVANSVTYSSKEWSSKLPGYYYRGVYADGTVPDTDHKTRLSLDCTIVENLEETCRAAFIDDVVSDKECNILVDYAKKSDKWGDAGDSFWAGRVINAISIVHDDPEIAKLMLEIQERMRIYLKKQYNLDKEIYPDGLQLVRWYDGMEQPVHADACDSNGVPHHLAWRDFGALVYLNDTFDGGQTFYDNFGLEIQPKAGRMAAHPGDFLHNHGVRKISNGMRFTLVTFWTFDKSHYHGLELTDPLFKESTVKIKEVSDAVDIQDCEYIISIYGTNLLTTATIAHDNSDSGRIANGTWISRYDDPVIDNIRKKVSELSMLPISHQDVPHLVKYSLDGEYKAHHDYFYPESADFAKYTAHCGQRIGTYILYLNDNFTGGETVFPEINKSVSPKTGKICSWSNVKINGDPEPLSLHAGLPVTSGEKWILIIWVREHPVNIQ